MRKRKHCSSKKGQKKETEETPSPSRRSTRQSTVEKSKASSESQGKRGTRTKTGSPAKKTPVR